MLICGLIVEIGGRKNSELIPWVMDEVLNRCVIIKSD
jgi:hypothetical protein